MLLDYGNTVLNPANLGQAALTSDESRRAVVFLDFFSMLGYDALNVGEAEIFLGKDTLLKHKALAGKLISANILDKKTQKPVFMPYLLIEKAGKRFLITGLFPSEFSGKLKEDLDKNGIAVADPSKTLREIIKSEKGKYDFFIVLNALPLSQSTAIVKVTDGIDLLIGTRDTSHDGPELTGKKAAISVNPPQGKYYSVLAFSKLEPGRGFTDTKRILLLTNKISTLDGQIAQTRMSSLDRNRKRQELANIAEIKENYKRALSEIDEKLKTTNGNKMASTHTPLNSTIKDDPETVKLLETIGIKHSGTNLGIR